MSEKELDVGALREALKGLGGKAGAEGEVSPEEIWDAVEGKAPPERVRELLDRSLDDPELAEAWRVAAEMKERIASEAVPAASVTAAPAERRIPWRGVALAVAAVAVVALLLPFWKRSPVESVDEPVFRNAQQWSIAAAIPEETPLPRDAFELGWSAGPEGTYYDVEVATEELVPIVTERGLTENRFTVDSALLADLPAGARLLWKVEARLPDGRRIGSPTFIATLE